jgi:hypothetical protein
MSALSLIDAPLLLGLIDAVSTAQVLDAAAQPGVIGRWH